MPRCLPDKFDLVPTSPVNASIVFGEHSLNYIPEMFFTYSKGTVSDRKTLETDTPAIDDDVLSHQDDPRKLSNNHVGM